MAKQVGVIYYLRNERPCIGDEVAAILHSSLRERKRGFTGYRGKIADILTGALISEDIALWRPNNGEFTVHLCVFDLLGWQIGERCVAVLMDSPLRQEYVTALHDVCTGAQYEDAHLHADTAPQQKVAALERDLRSERRARKATERAYGRLFRGLASEDALQQLIEAVRATEEKQ